jgi:hypothetical protein
LLGITLFVVDFRVVTRALKVIPLEAFAFSFLLNFAGSIVVPAIQTRIALAATRIRLNLAQLIAINLMVRFYVLVLPRPAAVGARWWAYRGSGSLGRGAEAAALMVFERVVQGLVLSGALVILLVAERDRLPDIIDALLGVAFGMLLIASAAFAAFLWAPAAAIPRSVLRLRGLPSVLRSKGAALVEALAAYPGLPISRVAGIVALSVVYFVLFVASFWVLLQGLGSTVDFMSVAWIRAAVFLLTLVPVTIGGIGLREAGFVGLLRLYDVPEPEALAAALAALAVQLLLGGLGAGIALARTWKVPTQDKGALMTSEEATE